MSHAAATLVSVIASGEPSKTPFYIAGGGLVVWAVILAAIGLNRPDFPGSLTRSRLVMLISFVLVATAMALAVATSAKRQNNAAEVAKGQKAEDRVYAQTNAQVAPPAPAAPAAKPAAPSKGPLALAADPGGQLKYDQTSLTAKAGRVEIDFTNKSPVPHDVYVAKGAQVLGKSPIINGKSTKLTAKLTPGTYAFYCSVDGHRQAGMQGTLTVQ